jgi:hypothetical protein
LGYRLTALRIDIFGNGIPLAKQISPSFIPCKALHDVHQVSDSPGNLNRE